MWLRAGTAQHVTIGALNLVVGLHGRGDAHRGVRKFRPDAVAGELARGCGPPLVDRPGR